MKTIITRTIITILFITACYGSFIIGVDTGFKDGKSYGRKLGKGEILLKVKNLPGINHHQFADLEEELL